MEIIKSIFEAFDDFNKNSEVQLNYNSDYQKTTSLIFLTYFLRTNKENNDFGMKINDAIKLFYNFNTSNENTQDQKVIIYEYINDTLEDIKSASMKYFMSVSKEDAKYYLNNFNTTLENPRESLGFFRNDGYINELAKNLLKLNRNDKVSDFCAGLGDFSQYAFNQSQNIIAYESKKDLVAIGNMMLFTNNISTKLVQKDLLKNEDLQFDKIFCDLPISKSVSVTPEIENWASIFKKMDADDSNTFPIGMLLFEKIYRSLNEGGTAVVFTANPFIVSPSYKQFWKYLFQNFDKCFINAIIQLPSNIVQGTSLPGVMIVLKKTDNEKIRMIDAIKAYVSSRFQNKFELNSNNIDTITKAFTAEGSSNGSVNISDNKDVRFIDISVNKIREKLNNGDDINLSPFYWCNSFNNSEQNKEYSLSDLCIIRRGIQLSKEKLNELCGTVNDTGDKTLYYLPQTLLKENQISDDLPIINLDGLSNKQIMYTLAQNDIVLCSARSNPLKLAIIDEDEHRNILASSNIYIIRLNAFSKYLPDFVLNNPELKKAYVYYIKTCLESESTMNLIETSNNSSLKIYVNTLEQIKIPEISETSLIEFSEKYKKMINYAKEVKDLSNDLHDIVTNLQLSARYESDAYYSQQEQEDIQNI